MLMPPTFYSLIWLLQGSKGRRPLPQRRRTSSVRRWPSIAQIRSLTEFHYAASVSPPFRGARNRLTRGRPARLPLLHRVRVAISDYPSSTREHPASRKEGGSHDSHSLDRHGCVACTTMPAQAATTDPEVIFYRFSGVRHSGSSADTGTATDARPAHYEVDC